MRPQLELCWPTLGSATPPAMLDARHEQPGSAPPQIYQSGLPIAEVSLSELIDAAAAAGFQAITVTPKMCRTVGRDPAQDRELRRRLQDAGVTVSVVDPLVNGLPRLPPPESIPTRDRWLFEPSEEDCYRIAEALGASAINVAHVRGSPAPIQEWVDTVGALAHRAKSHGLQIALEFIPGTGIGDLTTALAIVSAIGAPNLGITFDVWHFHRSGGTIHDLKHLPPHAIFGIHVSDATDKSLGGAHVPGADRLLPGQGGLPLIAFLKLLLAGRSDLRVGVEVPSVNLRQMHPRDAAETVHQAVSQVLAGLV